MTGPLLGPVARLETKHRTSLQSDELLCHRQRELTCSNARASLLVSQDPTELWCARHLRHLPPKLRFQGTSQYRTASLPSQRLRVLVATWQVACRCSEAKSKSSCWKSAVTLSLDAATRCCPPHGSQNNAKKSSTTGLQMTLICVRMQGARARCSIEAVKHCRPSLLDRLFNSSRAKGVGTCRLFHNVLTFASAPQAQSECVNRDRVRVCRLESSGPVRIRLHHKLQCGERGRVPRALNLLLQARVQRPCEATFQRRQLCNLNESATHDCSADSQERCTAPQPLSNPQLSPQC